MTLKAPKSILADSAILIGIGTGLCYILGFLALTRCADDYGIPWHLLPELSLHHTLTIGALHLLFFLAIGLFFYLLYIYLGTRIKSLKAIQRYFEKRFLYHRISFSIFLTLISVSFILVASPYVDSPTVMKRISYDKIFPKVIELKIQNVSLTGNADSWNYISRKNGLFVFGQLKKKHLLLIKEEKVEKLIIKLPEK